MAGHRTSGLDLLKFGYGVMQDRQAEDEKKQLQKAYGWAATFDPNQYLEEPEKGVKEIVANLPGNVAYEQVDRFNKFVTAKQAELRKEQALRERQAITKTPQYGPLKGQYFGSQNPNPAGTASGIQDRLARSGMADNLDYADKYAGLTKQIKENNQQPERFASLTGDAKNLAVSLGRVPTMRELQEYRAKGASQITNNLGYEQPQTPGQKKTDETYPAQYLDWKAKGGYADVQKQLEQLNEVSTNLKSGKNLTGKNVGMMPDWGLKFINPEAIANRDAVEEVVQRNLRLILGAQFTEREGTRLIERAYNPSLDEKENAKRVDRLIRQIDTAAQAQESAAQYYEQNGTLTGWKGQKPELGDFYDAVDGPQKEESKYKEGQTATNKKTGEKMIFKGGQWEKM